jgi:hypothetical protein
MNELENVQYEQIQSSYNRYVSCQVDDAEWASGG